MATYKIFVADQDGYYKPVNNLLFSRFRKAWQSINNGSSVGYTSHFALLHERRLNNAYLVQGEEDPIEPCVYFRLNGTDYAIMDIDEWRLYKALKQRYDEAHA